MEDDMLEHKTTDHLLCICVNFNLIQLGKSIFTTSFNYKSKENVDLVNRTDTDFLQQFQQELTMILMSYTYSELHNFIPHFITVPYNPNLHYLTFEHVRRCFSKEYLAVHPLNQESGSLVHWLHHRLKAPFSLMELARKSILQEVDRNTHYREKLQYLPKPLQWYLNYSDLDFTLVQ